MAQQAENRHKRFKFAQKKKNKDVLFVENYYRDSSNFHKMSFQEFVFEFFSDACIRHKDSRLVVCEMVSNGGHTFPKKQEAHRVREEEETGYIKHTHTHISPFLYKSNGNYKGKGIRLKTLVSASVAIGLDFDSLESFAEADKKKDALKFPEWDAVIYTGGRGVQAWYYLDAFPLRNQRQLDFYENVKDSLIATLNSDKKASLLTQILRLPDTLHPRTGRKSEGFVRRDFQKDSKGKLLRLANILKANGLLKSKPAKRRSRVEECDAYRKAMWERLDQGPLSGKNEDLANGFGISEKQFTRTISKWKKEGQVKTSPLRNDRNRQRNAGVFIEKLIIKRPSDTDTLRVHCNSESLTHRQKALQVLSKYLKHGAPADYRNTLLFSMAVLLYAMGFNSHRAGEKLKAGNLKSPFPLSEDEFSRTFDSAFSGKYEGVNAYWLKECEEGLGINSLLGENANGKRGDSSGENITQSDCDLAEIEKGQGVEEKKESLPQSGFDFRDFESVFGNIRVIELCKSGDKSG